jgi:hypothetical protein
MINSVRATVLSVANKNNFGYISPEDFNLYAKQAQIDIFEDYFYQYNQWIVKQNARVSGSGFADIVKNIEDVIDIFVSESTIASPFALPSDLYFINRVRYGNKEVDRVTHDKILNLNSSNLTAPSTLYPVYTSAANAIEVYPTTINSIKVQYIRTPKDPKWTYTSLSGGQPMFNQGAVDYQDFELPLRDEPMLVAKILEYSGISIREAELNVFGNTEESKNKQIEG